MVVGGGERPTLQSPTGISSLRSDIPARLRRAFPKEAVARLKASFRHATVSFGGGEGIRTPDTVTRTPVFEAGSFNHSDTPPIRVANIAKKIN